MRLFFYCILGFFAFMLSAVSAAADGTAPRPLLVVYDSSNSMWGELSDSSRKYEAGRSAIDRLLQSRGGERQLGFRAYGHRDKSSCRDTQLLVPLSAQSEAGPKISQAVSSIRPVGKTPITYSLQEALKDLGGADGDILLISDGIETCDFDPCELMRQWQASNVNIRVHVVGVGLSEMERASMQCIASISGGSYFDAESQDQFAEVVLEAGAQSEMPAPEDKDPIVTAGYELVILATDDRGRSYLGKGALLKDGQEIAEVSTNGRNRIEAPGEYSILVGPLLSDGTIYKPVEATVLVSEPGETKVSVIVERPAIVSAAFFENSEPHSGSLVSVYQDTEEKFNFRAFDEALAAPGKYEFRAKPNADNDLRVTAELSAGEETEIVFELLKTVQMYVEFVLSDGSTIRRNSELWRDDQKVYSIHSGNGALVLPGTYTLKSDDQNIPLTPIPIEIKDVDEVFSVPLKTGSVSISYAGSDFDYAGRPDRAFIESVDRSGQSYAALNTPVMLAPGQYLILPQNDKGFFEPIQIELSENQNIDVSFTPQPLGEIVVNYDPGAAYKAKPDRAFVEPLDAQRIISGYMTPGVSKKFLPGRYLVKAKKGAGNIAPIEVVVQAGETKTVTFRPN